ncbi:MAG: hypothetical protein ACM3SS_18065 [Rhodospirillaceae bacterium]
MRTSRTVSGPGVATSIAIWALHFTVVYGYTALACARGYEAAITAVVNAATVLAVCAAALVLWRSMLTAERDWLGAGVAGLALFAIVLEGLPVWIVSPCA